MILGAAIVVGLATFGILTQRTLLGVLVSVQLLFSAVVISLGTLATERGRDMALLVLIFSGLQALAGLGFVVRMHYLGSRGSMDELKTMRH